MKLPRDRIEALSTPVRLVCYGVGVLAVFGLAFGSAKLIAPSGVSSETAGHAAHDDNPPATSPNGTDMTGLSLSANGYTLRGIDAPTSVAAPGRLSFTISDSAGRPVTEFARAHDKDLHLMVVRTDGTDYRHVHPELDGRSGTWSLPWTWRAAGSYRVFADFTPTGGPATTLSRVVDVAGDFTPTPLPAEQRTTTVDGYTATLTGDLRAGSTSTLRVEISRDGAPVAELQPYLGAFGHLVALRSGDLAYLHVHAMGDEPSPGDVSGPEIEFMATAPSQGRYWLYLDFAAGGAVHTATFALDAPASATAPAQTGEHAVRAGH